MLEPRRVPAGALAGFGFGIAVDSTSRGVVPRCVATLFLISCGAEPSATSVNSAVPLGLAGSLWLAAQLREFCPVTEVVLRNPLPWTG